MVRPTSGKDALRPEGTSPSGASFDRLVATASRFWPQNVAARKAGRVILVDLKCQDLRVALRLLTYAQAVRRVVGAEVVCLSGLDPEWRRHVWNNQQPDALIRLAKAYGVRHFLDYNELLERLAQGGPTDLSVNDRPLDVPAGVHRDDGWLDATVMATAARIMFVPRVTEALKQDPEYARIADRSRQIAQVNDGILASWDVMAVVTAHVDYADWGLLVHQAVRGGVPVSHVQSTGGLKVYTTFDAQPATDHSVRAETTRAVADDFERHVWPHRDLLRRPAELTAWRSKVNLGKPSWWRGGGHMSDVQYTSLGERGALRRQVCTRFGWDHERPVVAVFNHAVSDALGTNREAFTDLADWFEQTVEYAVAHPEVNWLLVDHPSQHFYDGTGFFEELAARHRHAHLHFTQSLALTKNSLWSLVDLAVTVRGSVSNEFPAYGVPALQAGWSEWSSLGFTRVAETPEKYWKELAALTADLLDGKELISDTQVERARLWMWLYRCGADVVSPLLPHWSVSDADALCSDIELAMRHVEVDGDPIFAAVRRMWLNREPWLTRWDFRNPAAFADHLAPVDDADRGGRPTRGWLATSFDTPAVALEPPGAVRRGDDAALVSVDHIARGSGFIGRINGPFATTAIRVVDVAYALRVNVRIGIDDLTDAFWAERVKTPQTPPRVRAAEVWCQGVRRGAIVVDPDAASRFDSSDGVHRAELGFRLEASELDDSGVLVVEIRDPGPGFGQSSSVGIRLIRIRIFPAPHP